MNATKTNVEVKRNLKGVWYIYDYIPTRMFSYRPNEAEQSKRMWAYKNYASNSSSPDNKEAYNSFTSDLKNVILQIMKRYNIHKAALVTMPSSTAGKVNSITESAKRISKEEIGLQDCTNMLERKTSIGTAHRGQRTSSETQLNSLICNKCNNLDYSNTYFFVMDDVYTLGTSLNVGQEMLKRQGVPASHIIKLAISQTVRG